MTRTDLKHVPLAPLRDQLGVEIKFDVLNPIQHDPASALGAAVQLLASLEHSVCRRYLKPPLVRKGGASEFSSLPSLSESGLVNVVFQALTFDFLHSYFTVPLMLLPGYVHGEMLLCLLQVLHKLHCVFVCSMHVLLGIDLLPM